MANRRLRSQMALSEWATRKQLIDSMLATAGWRVVPFDSEKAFSGLKRCAIEEYPTDNGPADYELCDGGQAVGIVEAKKLTLGPQNVFSQAERYSRGLKTNPLNFAGFHVPFLYSTNGEVIWYHDVRHALNRSRQVAGFHTPEALAERFNRDFTADCGALIATPNA